MLFEQHELQNYQAMKTTKYIAILFALAATALLSSCTKKFYPSCMLT